MSMLISLTHYWDGDEIKTDVNVYLSADKHHDTHYFQHCFEEHARKYADRIAEGGFHYVYTDGSPSHFKNRFSITFLIVIDKRHKVKVMWSFNAPSHGKGPWDGLGAVIKTLLRRMEQNKKFPGHVYMETCEDGFFFLAQYYSGMTTIDDDIDQWYGEQRMFLDKSVTEMSFAFVKVAPEEMEDGLAAKWEDGGKHSVAAAKVAPHGHRVLDPIKRPESKPQICSIPGMKTRWFCFMPVGSNRIATRERSCHCAPCRDAGHHVYRIGRKCMNYDTCGPWRVFTVKPNDDEWDRVIAFLTKEGKNTTGRWNDYCGCYAERLDPETQQFRLQEEELTFGCGEGGAIFGCTFCFNSAHAVCIGLGDQRTSAPRGDWACPACVDHATKQLQQLSVDDLPSEEVEDLSESGDESDEGEEGMSIQQIKDPKTTVGMLRGELRRLQLPLKGRKQTLVSRLLDYHGD